MPPVVAIVGLTVIAVLILITTGLVRTSEGLAGRLGARIRQELRMLMVEFHEQKRRIPLATAIHFLAWLTDGVQVWMAAAALGLDLSLYAATVMASAAYAIRILLAFVPAGLVAQEAGFVAAGLVFGIDPPQALTLSLVLRLRDVVFGLPLLAWPLFEYRHRRKLGAASAH
jgi:uncharacterized membrane protein YbhN (UPF0104 family)